MQNERFLRRDEVLSRTGMSTSTLYATMKDGGFPKPVKVVRRSCWIESEVQAWIDGQIAKREAA